MKLLVLLIALLLPICGNCSQRDPNIIVGSSFNDVQAIEDSLKANNSSNSGTSKPSYSEAGTWWFDTANDLMKYENNAGADKTVATTDDIPVAVDVFDTTDDGLVPAPLTDSESYLKDDATWGYPQDYSSSSDLGVTQKNLTNMSQFSVNYPDTEFGMNANVYLPSGRNAGGIITILFTNDHASSHTFTLVGADGDTIDGTSTVVVASGAYILVEIIRKTSTSWKLFRTVTL